MPRKYKGGHTQKRNFNRYTEFQGPVKRYHGKIDPLQTELPEYTQKKGKGKRKPI